MSVAHLLAAVVRAELGATGVNLRSNNGRAAGQDVHHFHLHVVPRYEGDTVQPGCSLGRATEVSRPPAATRSAAACADTIRRGIAGQIASGGGRARVVLSRG